MLVTKLAIEFENSMGGFSSVQKLTSFDSKLKWAN